ncbi:hypothetical protein KY285_023814 [Solanum tuberosum]|nr:hypothetical protein KY289_024143 [Solanum tuberosum]KAH0676013.1 hypothetical protein KY285_023814 [Solanum tuberosum]
MALYKVSFLAHLLVLGMLILVSTVEHVNACTKECGNLGYGYAQVQKEVQKIQFVPIVAQAIRVATIIMLRELLFVKERLIPKIITLAPYIVIHKLPIQSVPVQKDRR